MQVTSTGIAITLAIVIALGFLFFGPAIFNAPAMLTASPNDDLTSGNSSATTPGSGPRIPIPETLPTTLQFADTVVGNGAEVKPGDTVTVHYVGQLTDGRVFDASETRGPFSFTVGAGSVIRGWEEGLLGMRAGGVRVLVIPPEFGYGEAGAGGVIPPNATLLFEVRLLSVEPGTGA